MRKRLLAAVVPLLVLASCNFHETEQFVAFDAPPNGVHITIYKAPTSQLNIVRDLVASGRNIDTFIRDAGFNFTCSTGTGERGDRCAWRVIRAQDIELEGGVLDWAKETVADLFWGDAISESNFDDFRGALAETRGTERCLHVTIRNWGDWPIEWRDSNWTYREDADSRCIEGKGAELLRGLAALVVSVLLVATAGCSDSVDDPLGAENAVETDPCDLLPAEAAAAAVGADGEAHPRTAGIIRGCDWVGPEGTLSVEVLPRADALTSDDGAAFNSDFYASPDTHAVDIDGAVDAVIIDRAFPIGPIDHVDQPASTFAATFADVELMAVFVPTAGSAGERMEAIATALASGLAAG